MLKIDWDFFFMKSFFMKFLFIKTKKYWYQDSFHHIMDWDKISKRWGLYYEISSSKNLEKL